ncbi:MAG: DUF2057 domain-containing protein [Ketobacteraceae bacterium]|nr:DUF2057 domain-containing protein [Ketobacteraceae bacterium]
MKYLLNRLPLLRISCVLVLLLPVGCATQQNHDWYQGEAASGAVLKSWPTILVEAIDGRDAGAAFIGQQHSYELAPGEHKLVVTYADMFDLKAGDFEKVASAPVKIVFTARAGETYQLKHDAVEGIKAARAFAKNPELAIVNTGTDERVAHKVEHAMPKRLLPTFRFASEDEPVFASDNVPAREAPTGKPDQAPRLASDNALSPLRMLQFSWEQASDREREAFLQWIENRQ